MVRPRITASSTVAIIVIAAWISVAALGTFLLPTPTSELREMFAFSQIIPILVGAFYFGQAGGLLVAFAASLVSGSLVILNMNEIDTLFVQRVMFQIISFNSVALLTSFLSDQEKLHRHQVTQQLERITALRAIDKAITSNTDLSSTLYILLESLSHLLEVEAAAILLRDPRTDQLDLKASLGFFGAYPSQPGGLVKDGATRAAREKQTVHYPDLAARDPAISNLIHGKGVIAYYAVPLMAHDELKGVLEVFDRASHPDEDWKNYLETLAGQAAIAIDHSKLLENLQTANAEMSQAYEATLRGWSRALDLRDKETEGHTQRVVAVSMQLATRMGIQGEQLTNFQRGAILHDIGKMGVPDEILLKPGPLGEQEWTVMHKHPIYAQMLLSPIQYLEKALLIPYFHHERWDGSGYPLGLRGIDMPLEARIFAVVDVWDALRSDRPYRKALTDEETLAYLREQSGKQFDPDVVDNFLNMLDEMRNPVSLISPE
jgi:response regulator RpfG family c-di-GMP phosphodiesterase